MRNSVLLILILTCFCANNTFAQKGKINLIPNLVYPSPKENLGKEINTKYNEICPIVAPDGNTLYFIRSANPENIGGEKKKNQDVWCSFKDSKGVWGKAFNIGTPINNKSDNGIASAFPDNNSLLIFGTYEKNGKRKGDGISISKRTSAGWSLPQNQHIENFYHKEGPLGFYLCNDKKTLLMSIFGKDSYGRNDIYVSFLQENKTWSEPKNIGKTINTQAIEGVPFMASDNKTMYFASTGHSGYGGADLFVTERLDDTWQKWSEPKNLGKGINTSGNEWRINIPASGDFAYFSSTKGSIGGEDLYRIQLPVVTKPKPVVIIQGKVIDKKSKQPVETEIVYVDIESSTKIGFANSNSTDGSYKIVLPGEKRYSFYTTQDEYYPISQNIDLLNLEQNKTLNIDLEMVKIQTIEKGEKVRLNNIFFETNKSELKPESFEELNRLIKLLNAKASMKIKISGHTDDVGTKDYNLQLSKERAEAVVQYLINKGIHKDRLQSEGYGMSKPEVENTNDANRAINRRVEFQVIEK